MEFFVVSMSFSGVDSVGTVSASLVTYASIQAFKPDLVIDGGTAGGFKVCVFLRSFSLF
jgi:nucleoside phosphorylase